MAHDEKVKLAAFIRAKHDMTLDQCRDAVTEATREVGDRQAALTKSRSRLAGLKDALKEKTEALR
jgi:hypothetical protein